MDVEASGSGLSDVTDDLTRTVYSDKYIRRLANQAARSELSRLFATVSAPPAAVSPSLPAPAQCADAPLEPPPSKIRATEAFCEDFSCCDFEPQASSSAQVFQEWLGEVQEEFVKSDDLHQDITGAILSDSDSSGNDGDSSDDCEGGEHSLPVLLQLWSCRYDIPHIALDSLLCILRQSHPELPKDSRTLKATPTKTDIKVLHNGQYSHLGLKEGLLLKLKHGMKPNCTEISVDIFIDGIKFYNSTMSESWPILFRSEDLVDDTPGVVGLFYGDGKPDSIEDFLASTVSELKDLFEEGVSLSNAHYKVKVRYYLADAPARSYLKCIMGPTSYHGCERCDAEGDYENQVVYSITIGNLRTDESFDAGRDEEHHNKSLNNGISPLKPLKPKFISQVPLDPMHLIDLGVCKRFTEYVMGKAPKHLRVVSNQLFGEFLASLSNHRPCEFTRMPVLRKFCKWKASEYRMLLLYMLPVIFKFLVCEEVYNLFTLLHSAVFIMHSDSLIAAHLDHAEKFLSTFVEYSSELFGRKFVVYNVHSAMHLPDDVRRFGNLRKFWAYPFEDKLGKIKKLVRSGNKPLQQISRRLAEKEKASEIDCNYAKKKPKGLMNVHRNGPLADLLVTKQYSKYEHELFTVSIVEPDNCVCLSDGTLGHVQNIVSCRDTRVMVIVRLFEGVDDLYTYPMPSSDLGVVVVSGLSGEMKCYPLSDVLFKCFFLPYETGEGVAIPLVHTL